MFNNAKLSNDFRWPNQLAITSLLGGIQELCVAIEHRIRTATSIAEALPQAILSKAFSGELVPTEADLARAEGREYESAEQLLARIARDQEEAHRQSMHPKTAMRTGLIWNSPTDDDCWALAPTIRDACGQDCLTPDASRREVTRSGPSPNAIWPLSIGAIRSSALS
jgi:hypothetical protein